jgi:hypothetical protein
MMRFFLADFLLFETDPALLDNYGLLSRFPGNANIPTAIAAYQAGEFPFGIFPLPGDFSLDLDYIGAIGSRLFSHRNLLF